MFGCLIMFGYVRLCLVMFTQLVMQLTSEEKYGVFQPYRVYPPIYDDSNWKHSLSQPSDSIKHSRILSRSMSERVPSNESALQTSVVKPTAIYCYSSMLRPVLHGHSQGMMFRAHVNKYHISGHKPMATLNSMKICTYNTHTHLQKIQFLSPRVDLLFCVVRRSLHSTVNSLRAKIYC
jgi:hypothetical protein